MYYVLLIYINCIHAVYYKLLCILGKVQTVQYRIKHITLLSIILFFIIKSITNI